MADINIKNILFSLVLFIVAFIVILNTIGITASDLKSSSSAAASSGLPLAGFFSPTGIVVLVVMVVAFLTILLMAFKSLKN